MNDELQTILEALQGVNPAALEYDEWLKVGSALKAAGGSAAMWDEWSRRDHARYRSGECEKKWNGLDKGAARVGAGSVVKMLHDQGGRIERNYNNVEKDEEIAFDGVIFYDGGTTQKKDLKIVRGEWLETKELPPEPIDWNGLKDFQLYIQTLFQSDECVGIVADAFQSEPDEEGKQKWMPKKGEYSRTAGELLELCSCADNLRDVILDYPEECGAWIRFNPLDGKGAADANVTAHRYALVESDEINIERQYAIYKELNLPIAAMVHSGGKSIHAIVRIDAPDYKEYQKRVDFLYDVCKKNGLVIDRKNRNPSRLSRLPGAIRKGEKQRLLHINIGAASWNEWAEWIAAQNDDLPEVESLETFFNNPPPLADCLITGLLRKGHKMLISGPSKAGKSFALLELCIAIAEGREWLGWNCTRGRVLYVNLELDRASCYHRLIDVYQALNWKPENIGNIDLWHLRGKALPMTDLAPRLIRRAMKRGYSAVIIDPIYKVITGDENAADQMAKFCNQFDKVCSELKCAVIYCHHHSKGDQGQKRAQDRASGSGVFARDPDALLDMIELEIDDQRRKTIIDRSGCYALCKMIDERVPGWKSDISQDDALVQDKLVAYALSKLPQAEVYAVTTKIEQDAAYWTGWRIGGILREFAGFKPRNVFFQYPIHPADSDGLLADALACGEERPRRTKEAAKEDSTERIIDETKAAFDALNDGGEPVTIEAMAEYMECEKQTVRDRLKKHSKNIGLFFKKGIVFQGKEKKDDDR